MPILFVEQYLGVIQSKADRCQAMERGHLVTGFDAAELADENTVASYLVV